MSDPHQKSVATLLHELRTEAEDLRKKTLDVERSVIALREGIDRASKDVHLWVNTFLDEGVMVDLGANVDLANATLARANGLQRLLTDLVSAIFGAFSKAAHSNDVARMADAIASGMTESATSCTCGLCNACKLVDARGPEKAVPEILKRMRATITTTRDTIVGGSSRIEIAKG